MAKRIDKSEPELIIKESVDEKTGIKTVIYRRGILGEKMQSLSNDDTPDMFKAFFPGGEKTIRQQFEESQEAIRTYLEAKGIPSGREPVFVSIKGEPFRPIKDSDTDDFLSKNTPYRLSQWSRLAEEKTERLSLDRAHVDYLLYIQLLLNEFDNSKLGLIENFASASYRLRLLETNINGLVSEQLYSAKRATEAGKKSGESRNAKADKNWRDPVLRLAIERREKKPELSQRALVSEIESYWKDDLQLLPTHDRLVRFIAAKEKLGALPRKKKDMKEFPS